MKKNLTKIASQSLFLLFLIFHAGKNYGDSFIEGNHNFALIKDKNVAARTWAFCSAAYSVLSIMQSSESPMYARRLNELSNGASVAIVMTYFKFANLTKSESAHKDFPRVWQHGLSMRQHLIETSKTHILSRLEVSLENSLVMLISDVEICSQNLYLQQGYIDAWREMRELGFFEN